MVQFPLTNRDIGRSSCDEGLRRRRSGGPISPTTHYHILAIYYHIFYIYSSFSTSCLGIFTITNHQHCGSFITTCYSMLQRRGYVRTRLSFSWFYAKLLSSKYHARLTQPNYFNFLHDNSINGGRERRSSFLFLTFSQPKHRFWGLGLTKFMDEEQILRFYDSHFKTFSFFCIYIVA